MTSASATEGPNDAPWELIQSSVEGYWRHQWLRRLPEFPNREDVAMGLLDRFGRTKGSAARLEHEFVVQAYRQELDLDGAGLARRLRTTPEQEAFALLLDVADQHDAAWKRALEAAVKNRRLFPDFGERLAPVETVLMAEVADSIGADRERFADATLRAELDREARSMPGKERVPRACLYMTYPTHEDAAKVAADLRGPDSSLALRADTEPHAECGLYHVREARPPTESSSAADGR